MDLFKLVNSYTYEPEEELPEYPGIKKFQSEIESYAADEDTAWDVAVIHFCLILNSFDIPHPRYDAFDITTGSG